MAYEFKKYRKIAGLTQDQAAAALGIPTRTYGSYERGEHEPSLITACAVCDVFGCTLDQLAGRSSVGSDLELMYNKMDEAHQNIVKAIIDASL